MSAALALVVPMLNERAAAAPLSARLAAAAQTCEVVVVDGGSSDGSAEVLRASAQRDGYRFVSAPRGRGAQMNAGAAVTSAPVLLFLHADTELPSGGLDAVTREVDRGAALGCFRLHIDSLDLRLRAAAAIINLRSSLLCSATGDQAIFVARDAFRRVGGFRELPLCEDLDLVHRLCGRGRFALLDAHVRTSARRWERGGVARTIGLMWALRLGWHLGIDPALLSRLYRADLR